MAFPYLEVREDGCRDDIKDNQYMNTTLGFSTSRTKYCTLKNKVSHNAQLYIFSAGHNTQIWQKVLTCAKARLKL